ncbi:acyltransferase family protein [Massilia sp. TSP1-1-2]|uniref:acyltransferase family protein n=1 Tax=Massilia sp. TSP1-1-2 TaxID=2804649 RepID=UPI003CEBE42F
MDRNGALDILKIILALMVVGIHASFLTEWSAVASYLTVNGLFRIAVPIFLLINGYFFFQVVVAGTALKWLKRILILYLVWMAIYLPYWLPDVHQNMISFVLRSGHTIVFGYTIFGTWPACWARR